jgi:hypothetical protein
MVRNAVVVKKDALVMKNNVVANGKRSLTASDLDWLADKLRLELAVKEAKAEH